MIFEIFRQTVERCPTRVAFAHGDRSVTYGELAREAGRVATGLVRQGFSRGDRVGILVESGLDYPVACLGVWRIRGVVVPFDVRAPSEDLLHRQAVADVRYAITRRAIGASLPDATAILLDEVGGAGEDPPSYDVQSGDDCLMLFTSGTTGGPKGLVHTQASMTALIRNHVASVGLTPEDVVLATVPFSSALGMCDLLLSAVATGVTVVIALPFSPRAALLAAGRNRVTKIITVPAIVKLLAAVSGSPELPTLRYVLAGAASLEPETRAQFRDRFGFHPVQCYGMSEVGRIAITGPLEEAPPPRNVGRPLLEVCLFDDDGNVVGPGTMGEIGVRSPSLCRVYLLGGARQEPLPMRGGYFLTGDLGVIGADGTLTLAGRKRGFILGSRFKVDPLEVEEVIRRHPGVRDVAVVPAPGRAGYESIRAVIVAHGHVTPTEISEFCATRLPMGRRPEIIDLVPEIPRNAMGKVEIGRLTAGGARPDRRWEGGSGQGPRGK